MIEKNKVLSCRHKGTLHQLMTGAGVEDKT